MEVCQQFAKQARICGCTNPPVPFRAGFDQKTKELQFKTEKPLENPSYSTLGLPTLRIVAILTVTVTINIIFKIVLTQVKGGVHTTKYNNRNSDK